MAISYTALKTELQTDPTAIGYASLLAAGNHTALAAALNLVRATISVFRGVIPTWELLSCVVKTEYAALTASDKQLFQIVLSCGEVDTTDSGIQTMLGSIYPNPSTTRTAMIARASRTGSRAEQLFGTGTAITIADIAKALAS